MTRDDVEGFLYREARFADENRYDEWLDLWADDALYWIPANADDYDPEDHVSIVYANRSGLQDRVDRWKSGAAWSQEPRSRMRRFISNIEFGHSDSEVLEVHSNFILVELRRELQTLYAAHQIHHLRPLERDLKIVFKKVILLNNDMPIHNMSFIV